MVAQPQIMASSAAGKSEMDSRIGFIGGMILKRLMTVPWAFTGIMAIALYGYSQKFDADHTYGRMAAELLPAGCVGLMLACVMASMMDNCAVNMISFSGIYTNTIHQRLINPAASERSLVMVNRITSVIFALVSLALSSLFDNMPAAMRFLWKYVPLMGIAWFMAILWKRANRWGAIASFFAALTAAALAQWVLPEFQVFGLNVKWQGDAGLPYTILLYSISGIGAGILVSLITPREDPVRTEHFFMLLRTPIGQEHVLRQAGFREVPGNDTYELPAADEAREMRGFPVIVETEPQPVPGGASTATATMLKPVPVMEYPSADPELERAKAQSRRQSIAGFAAMIGVIAFFLVAIKILANWLSPG
jgi:Na+/proline symporter